jgi:hypothetical protein
MRPETNLCEPYEIGHKLHRAIQTKAWMLEVDALRDELASCTMENADQIRRQRLLVQAQRDEAERLHDFLKRTTMRPVKAPRA